MNEFDLTDLAALTWDDLPFRRALHHTAVLSHYKQAATSVIDNFRVVPREAESQHSKFIRIDADTSRDFEVKPGLRCRFPN